jgi:hypothetical protein
VPTNSVPGPRDGKPRPRPSDALDDPLEGAPPRQRPVLALILAALCDHANDAGVAWPSVETIAGRTHLSPRQVQRHLATLEALGRITATEGRQGGRGRSTRWHVTPLKGDTGDTVPPPERVTREAVKGDTGVTRTLEPKSSPNPAERGTENLEGESSPARGLTPRQAGTSPRARGTSPRAVRRQAQLVLEAETLERRRAEAAELEARRQADAGAAMAEAAASSAVLAAVVARRNLAG